MRKLERKRAMKKGMTIMILTLLVLTLAYPSFAQRGRGWGGQGGGPGSEGQSGERSRGMPGGGQSGEPTAVPDFQIIDLHLSVDQIARISALREACLKDIRPIQEEIFGKRGDLKLLWREKDKDQEKMANLQRQIKSLKDQMQDKIAGYVLEVRSLLTTDQDSLLRSYWPGLGSGKEKRVGPEAGYSPDGKPGNMDAGGGPRGNW
jgi:hypothetical protein